MNEKKFIVKETVWRDSYYDDEVTIDEFLKIIEDAKSKGATTISIEGDYDSSVAKVKIFYEREETDDEFNKRINQQRQYEREKEIYELREYNRLKQKFEK